MNILFTTRLPEIGFTKLHNYKLQIPLTPYFSKEELSERLAHADILVATYDYVVDASMLALGKNLRLVANFGVGYNNIDVAYCKTHNILVTNTPQPVIEPTAEHCFALMHAIAHRTAELDRKLRSANSEITFGVMNNLGVSLYNKQLGIIGMGRIGQAVARRAVACGMKVVYNNRHQLAKEIEELYGAKYVTLNELLSTSDYVSLNLPYTPDVKHIINSHSLSLMKPTSILINTARGAHIDEQVLIKALQTGEIAGAALDVYENEPIISPELLKLDNVVLSPHIGTGTIDGRLDMCRNVEENILFWQEGKLHKMNLV